MQCGRLFKVAVKIKYEDIVIFNRFITRQKAKEHMFIFFLPLIYLIICSFAYESFVKISLITILALILIGFILVLENIFLKPKRMYRNFEIFLSNVAFSFFENKILIESKGSKSKGVYNIDYDQLKAAYEAKDAFYIIAKNKQSYIIHKSYMYNRQVYLLREILLKRLDEDFKKMVF